MDELPEHKNPEMPQPSTRGRGRTTVSDEPLVSVTQCVLTRVCSSSPVNVGHILIKRIIATPGHEIK